MKNLIEIFPISQGNISDNVSDLFSYIFVGIYLSKTVEVSFRIVTIKLFWVNVSQKSSNSKTVQRDSCSLTH